MIALPLMHVVGWRWVFVLFGIPGIVWAVAWYTLVRDEPEENPR